MNASSEITELESTQLDGGLESGGKKLFSKMLPGSSYLQWLSIHAAALCQQSSVTFQYSDEETHLRQTNVKHIYIRVKNEGSWDQIRAGNAHQFFSNRNLLSISLHNKLQMGQSFQVA